MSPPRSTRGDAIKKNRRDDLISEVVEDAPDAIWVLEASVSHPLQFRIVYANAAFEQIYEVAREDALGQEATLFLATRALATDLEPTLAGLRAGRPFDMTRFHLRRDGRQMWLHVNYRPKLLDDRVRWMIISRDVTRAIQAQQRAEQLARAMEQVHEAIAVEGLYDERWQIDYVNHAFERLFQYASKELTGRSWRSLLAPDADFKRADDCRVGLATGQKVHAELLFRRKDASEILLKLSATPIAEQGTRNVTSAVTVFSDVTQSRREEHRLREQVNLDPLTGLFNRREFEQLLEASIHMTPEGGRAHVLLFIDLDGFKMVNDTLGHDAGDRVLLSVSNLLKSQLLPSDDLARWGGDEFAAILYFYDIPNAVKTANDMIDALREAPEAHGVGASIGVVPITAAATVEELMRCGDRMMYQAKTEGRNRVIRSST